MERDLRLTRVCRNSNVAHRDVERQTIIVRPLENDVLVLNGTGSAVWNLLDGERTVEEIARRVSNRFDVSFDDALRDVEDVSQELIDSGVAHVAADPRP